MATLLTLSAPAGAIAQEDAFASAPVKAPHSAARLLSAGAPQHNLYVAGVEIELQPGTITYWRQPGEAGSPPLFDFSASQNLASVEVLYPAPKHIDEAGTTVAGYDATVIFPIRVRPRDPAAPVTLRLALNYAACGKICLPAKAGLSLPLPQNGASPFAQAIAASEAAVPRKLTAAEAQRRFALERLGGSGETAWRLKARSGDTVLDVFTEVPDPLYLDSKRLADDGGFELQLVQSCCGGGKKPGAGVEATITVVTDKQALEAPVRLD